MAVKDESNNWGGVDGQPNLSKQWWDRVKYYARLAIERVKLGIDSVKELFSRLTSDERWGVMVEFEEINSEKFS
ncbi:hypothetical protein WKK05_38880 (plasmid) [Nostoc sp. UHCC 0302]|uniref:hypothetical protein n=1 Tax=Nostoc sp. UHCC 0302 TaxID=3134896 RepID=UPI00311C9B3A